MAGGKENARQKMINLMYLVFIAMLALNMSKEVLMTFGEIDREVVKSTKSLKESNKAAIQVIKNSAKNDSLQWYIAYQPISKIAEAANELTEFINKNDNELITPYEVNDVTYQSFKRPILEKDNSFGRTIDGSIPEMVGDYEVMDNSASYDEMLFTGDYVNEDNTGYTAAGQEFVRLVNNFRDTAIEEITKSDISRDTTKNKIWNDSKSGLIRIIEQSFNTDVVKVGKAEDKIKSWLHFNFEGFPEIASITKLTLMEEDVENVIQTMISSVNEVILGEANDDYFTVEDIRDRRNADLESSDGAISSDMPTAMVEAWTSYRQKLRDWPALVTSNGIPAAVAAKMSPIHPNSARGKWGEMTDAQKTREKAKMARIDAAAKAQMEAAKAPEDQNPGL